jgi:hypothetical protein
LRLISQWRIKAEVFVSLQQFATYFIRVIKAVFKDIAPFVNGNATTIITSKLVMIALNKKPLKISSINLFYYKISKKLDG